MHRGATVKKNASGNAALKEATFKSTPSAELSFPEVGDASEGSKRSACCALALTAHRLQNTRWPIEGDTASLHQLFSYFKQIMCVNSQTTIRTTNNTFGWKIAPCSLLLSDWGDRKRQLKARDSYMATENSKTYTQSRHGN